MLSRRIGPVVAALLLPVLMVRAQERPAVPLTLGQVLRAVRVENATVGAAAARIEAARARVPGATTWMAPMVGVNAMNIPLDSFNPLDAGMGVRFMVSQTLPWPGKLKPGERAAEEAVAGEEAALETQRRVLEVQATVAYTRLALLGHTRATYARQLGLVRQVADLAVRRYRTGAGSQQDVLRAGLEATQFEGRILSLQNEYEQAAGELRVLLGRDDADSLVAATSLDAMARAFEAGLPAEAPVAPGVAVDRPEFGQIAARRRAIAARLDGLRLAYRPDVTVNAEYAWVRGTVPDEAAMDDAEPMAAATATDPMAGADSWSVGFTFTLPVAPWSRRGLSAEEESWRAEERALEQEERALRQRIEAEQATARALARTARRTLHLYDAETTPQAGIAYEAAVAAYEAGNGDLSALLDAWRALFDIELARATVLAQYVQALAVYRQARGEALTTVAP